MTPPGPRNLGRCPIRAESPRPIGSGARTSVPRRAPPSACWCSTARSAPGCRARISVPTTSAARPSRAATSSSCHPARSRHPDARGVLRGRGRRRRDRDVRRVPARAERIRARRQDVRDQPPRGRARPRGRVRVSRADGRPRFVIGSIGPGTRLPSLGQIPYTSCATATSSRSTGSSRAASTCCSSRPSTTSSRPRPRSTGARRHAARGRAAPDHGAGDGRDDRPHARRHRDRRRAHRARGDAARRHRHELRDGPGRDDRAPALSRAAHAHVPLSRSRTPGCRASSTGTRTTTSRPTRSRRRTSASRPSSASTSSADAAAPRPSTCKRSSRGWAQRRRRCASAEHEPGCSSIYSHVPFDQELAYLAVGERTNANGSRKFRDAMLEADWDTCVRWHANR